MTLTLDYKSLNGTVTETGKLSNELDKYCNSLNSKVQKKLYSVDGGMSFVLSSADSNIKEKIKQLRERESNATDISGKAKKLLETAIRVDDDVMRTVEAGYQQGKIDALSLRFTRHRIAAASIIYGIGSIRSGLSGLIGGIRNAITVSPLTELSNTIRRDFLRPKPETILPIPGLVLLPITAPPLYRDCMVRPIQLLFRKLRLTSIIGR